MVVEIEPPNSLTKLLRNLREIKVTKTARIFLVGSLYLTLVIVWMVGNKRFVSQLGG